ncbi:MAG: hypothetical protein LUI60_07580 [Clostridia bacterium]|nr:hypothetical protein [Clostridia bacterium]
MNDRFSVILSEVEESLESNRMLRLEKSQVCRLSDTIQPLYFVAYVSPCLATPPLAMPLTRFFKLLWAGAPDGAPAQHAVLYFVFLLSSA